MSIQNLNICISDALILYDLKSISFFSILHRSCSILFIFSSLFYINFLDLYKNLVNSTILYKILGILIINLIIYYIIYIYIYIILIHFLYVLRTLLQRIGYILNEKQIYKSTLIFYLVILLLSFILILIL